MKDWWAESDEEDGKPSDRSSDARKKKKKAPRRSAVSHCSRYVSPPLSRYNHLSHYHNDMYLTAFISLQRECYFIRVRFCRVVVVVDVIIVESAWQGRSLEQSGERSVSRFTLLRNPNAVRPHRCRR